MTTTDRDWAYLAAVGQRVRLLRVARRYSQDAFAELAGVSRVTRPVGPVKPRPWVGASQHRHLVPQHQRSASLDAPERASSTSQPTTRMKIRYSSRSDTADDHPGPPSRSSLQVIGLPHFWNPTGTLDATDPSR